MEPSQATTPWIAASFSVKEGRENVGKEDLPRAAKVAVRCGRNFASSRLKSTFPRRGRAGSGEAFPLTANVRAGIARYRCSLQKVTSTFDQAASFCRRQHPLQPGQLDQNAYPRNQKKIGHAPAPPPAYFTLAFSSGQGFAG